MRTVVVYESMWGNTARLARAVAAGLGDVRLLDVAVTAAADLEDADLIVLGGPTHAFSMSRVATRGEAHRQGAHHGPSGRGIRELIDELPVPLPARVATYDSRVARVRQLPGSAARAAAKELRARHAAQVIDVQNFYVEDVAGPLVPGELARAARWGRALAGMVESELMGPEGARA